MHLAPTILFALAAGLDLEKREAIILFPTLLNAKFSILHIYLIVGRLIF
jgi:hypothetical protein